MPHERREMMNIGINNGTTSLIEVDNDKEDVIVRVYDGADDYWMCWMTARQAIEFAEALQFEANALLAAAGAQPDTRGDVAALDEDEKSR